MARKKFGKQKIFHKIYACVICKNQLCSLICRGGGGQGHKTLMLSLFKAVIWNQPGREAALKFTLWHQHNFPTTWGLPELLSPRKTQRWIDNGLTRRCSAERPNGHLMQGKLWPAEVCLPVSLRDSGQETRDNFSTTIPTFIGKKISTLFILSPFQQIPHPTEKLFSFSSSKLL